MRHHRRPHPTADPSIPSGSRDRRRRQTLTPSERARRLPSAARRTPHASADRRPPRPVPHVLESHRPGYTSVLKAPHADDLRRVRYRATETARPSSRVRSRRPRPPCRRLAQSGRGAVGHPDCPSASAKRPRTKVRVTPTLPRMRCCGRGWGVIPRLTQTPLLERSVPVRARGRGDQYGHSAPLVKAPARQRGARFV
jgi:hypothetical protein